MQHLLNRFKSALAIALLIAVGGLATMPSIFADDAATKKDAKKLTPKQEAAQKAMKERLAKQKKIQAMDPLAAPEGDLKETLAFINDIKSWQPNFVPPARPTPDELKDEEVKKKYLKELTAARSEAMKKIVEARKYLLTTIDKVLENTSLDEKDRIATIKNKISVLNEMSSNFGNADARKELEKVMEKYRDHENVEIANLAKTHFFVKKAQGLLGKKDDTTAAEVAKEGVELIKTLGSNLDQSAVSQISNAGRIIEMKEDNAAAVELYSAILTAVQSEEVKKSLALSEDAYKQFVRSNQLNLNRAGILGKPASLIGKSTTGETVDITSYKGKVVLIDFWATWCGPCIAELPNVVENYKKYHDKGFEVVAVSIDTIDTKDKLEKFVKEKEIPWVQIQSDDENAQGWEDQNATNFGVNGIPATYLVDRNGVIIQVNVRGEKLGKALEELLGPVEDKAEEKKEEEKKEEEKKN